MREEERETILWQALGRCQDKATAVYLGPAVLKTARGWLNQMLIQTSWKGLISGLAIKSKKSFLSSSKMHLMGQIPLEIPWMKRDLGGLRDCKKLEWREGPCMRCQMKQDRSRWCKSCEFSTGAYLIRSGQWLSFKHWRHILVHFGKISQSVKDWSQACVSGYRVTVGGLYSIPGQKAW